MPKLGFTTSHEHYITRCHHCGDSRNPLHGHLYISLKTGIYYCQKCGISGNATLDLFPDLEIDLSGISTDTPQSHENRANFDDSIIVYDLPYSTRKSLLNRKSGLYKGKVWDYFSMYYPNGKEVGYHLRRSKPDKQSHTHTYKKGMRKGISYYQAGLFNPLMSNSDKPITIVEGVFDVLSEDAVCVFGSITPSTRHYFRSQFVNIRFDGDVWVKNPQLAHRTIEAYMQDTRLHLMGVYVIMGGLDIDEITSPDMVKYVSRKELPDFLEYLQNGIDS